MQHFSRSCKYVLEFYGIQSKILFESCLKFSVSCMMSYNLTLILKDLQKCHMILFSPFMIICNIFKGSCKFVSEVFGIQLKSLLRSCLNFSCLARCLMTLLGSYKICKSVSVSCNEFSWSYIKDFRDLVGISQKFLGFNQKLIWILLDFLVILHDVF